MRIERICQHCQRVFHVDHWIIPRGGGKYCSKSCANKYTRGDIPARFWYRVALCEHGRTCQVCCWLWQSTLNRGYGHMYINGHMYGAHRISWMLFHNATAIPPASAVIRHSCHTPACVNPHHLTLGSQYDNLQDAVAAGRTERGSQRANAKLTEQDVQDIRALHTQGMTYRALADIYGVGNSVICRICLYQIWKHVP